LCYCFDVQATSCAGWLYFEQKELKQVGKIAEKAHKDTVF